MYFAHFYTTAAELRCWLIAKIPLLNKWMHGKGLAAPYPHSTSHLLVEQISLLPVCYEGVPWASFVWKPFTHTYTRLEKFRTCVSWHWWLGKGSFAVWANWIQVLVIWGSALNFHGLTFSCILYAPITFYLLMVQEVHCPIIQEYWVPVLILLPNSVSLACHSGSLGLSSPIYSIKGLTSITPTLLPGNLTCYEAVT